MKNLSCCFIRESFARVTQGYNLTKPLTTLEPQNSLIGEFYAPKNRRVADFEVLNLQNLLGQERREISKRVISPTSKQIFWAASDGQKNAIQLNF